MIENGLSKHKESNGTSFVTFTRVTMALVDPHLVRTGIPSSTGSWDS